MTCKDPQNPGKEDEKALLIPTACRLDRFAARAQRQCVCRLCVSSVYLVSWQTSERASVYDRMWGDAGSILLRCLCFALKYAGVSIGRSVCVVCTCARISFNLSYAVVGAFTGIQISCHISFLRVSWTNYCRLGESKQQKAILSQFHRL